AIIFAASFALVSGVHQPGFVVMMSRAFMRPPCILVVKWFYDNHLQDMDRESRQRSRGLRCEPDAGSRRQKPEWLGEPSRGGVPLAEPGAGFEHSADQ